MLRRRGGRRPRGRRGGVAVALRRVEPAGARDVDGWTVFTWPEEILDHAGWCALRVPLPVAEGTPYLRNGWQSWSATFESTLGSRVERHGPGDRAHEAIVDPPYEGDETYDVLAADGFVAGFLDGGGVLVARPADGELLALSEGPDPRPELWWREGERAPLLADLLARARGRVPSELPTGWCTWYCRFHRISERTTDIDLRGAASIADTLDVFQVDDNYQAAVGDWDATNGRFPGGLERLVDRVGAAGFRPGLWTAPLLLSPSSRLADAHPDWFLRRPNGRRVAAAGNRHWNGVVYALDVSRPDVLDWLEGLFAHLVALGFTYLKLDFLFAGAMEGVRARPISGADALRGALAAIRRGAGEDAFLVGCGCPLWPAIGLVDAMRIGPDVAPYWSTRRRSPTAPSMVNAWRSARARLPLHGALWANDPDCVMLRRRRTRLTEERSRDWARFVTDTGQLLVLSDRFSDLDGGDRRLWRDLVTLRGNSQV